MTDDIIRVGINGFGRIGRMVLRVTLNKPNIRVVAINDPFLAPDYMAYQLRYDSTQGKFPLPVTGYTEEEKDSFLDIENYGKIRVFQTKVPGEIEWDSCGVQYVIESTGIFLTFEKASAHLGGSVKQVLLSAPSKAESGDDAKPAPRMFVMGVNEETYDPNEPGAQIISNASCTTNCLAPIVKALDTGFGDDNGIESGLMTTVHAVTATQKTVDAPSKKWRSGRGGFQNIIPASTGAAKAVGKVYPKLNGKLNGMAFRVPVPDGSVVDLTAVMKQPVTKEQLDAAMRGMSEGAMQGVLGYEEDQIVSSDIIGSPYSSIYDSGASMVQGNIVKVISWYDNEWGYSCRLVDLLQFVASQPAPPPLQ